MTRSRAQLGIWFTELLMKTKLLSMSQLIAINNWRRDGIRKRLLAYLYIFSVYKEDKHGVGILGAESSSGQINCRMSQSYQ